MRRSPRMAVLHIIAGAAAASLARVSACGPVQCFGRVQHAASAGRRPLLVGPWRQPSLLCQLFDFFFHYRFYYYLESYLLEHPELNIQRNAQGTFNRRASPPALLPPAA